MRVTLVDVYINTQALSRKVSPDAIGVLWKLMEEREPHVNISHKRLPTMEQHKAFVASEPYLEWFLLRNDEGNYVGAIYVTRSSEVGIFILQGHRGKGYGRHALSAIKSRYPKTRLLANIAPGNVSSQKFFAEAGFKLTQYTYELTR